MSRTSPGVLLRLLTLIAVAAAAAPAAAQTTKVVVLPYAPVFGEAPQSVGDRTSELVVKELGSYREFQLVDRGERGGAAKAPGLAEVAAAEKEIKEALSLFDKGSKLNASRKVKLAADSYEKGIQKFLQNFHGTSDFAPLSDAYVQLAIARVKLGMEDESSRLLEDLSRLDPARELVPPEVPPVFAALHDKSRRAQYARGFGQIRLASTPAGATVELDGRVLGETPLLARDVLVGDHYLRVSKPGQGVFFRRVRVTQNEVVELAADLTGEAKGPAANLARVIGANQLDAQAATAARDVAQAAGADAVVFGAVYPTPDGYGVRSYLLLAKDARVVGLNEISFDVEMLGAPIQVLNLVNDLAEKLLEPPEGLPLPLPVVAGLRNKGASEAVREVKATPALRSAVAEEDTSRRSGRGPIRTDEPRSAAVAGGTAANGKAAAPAEEAGGGFRRRGRIGAEEQPTARASDGEETAAPRLDPGYRPTGVSSLTPEQLRQLEVDDKKKGPGAGQIALWSGVGIVGAAVIGGVIYFIAAPPPATSATAHITW